MGSHDRKMTRVVVRAARPNELSLVYSLDQNLLEREEPYPYRDITTWWVALDEGRIVGISGMLWFGAEDALFVCSSAVAQSHRGRRLQQRMIRAMVVAGRRWGYPRIMTYTMPHNAPSARSFVRCGFLPYTPRHLWWGDDVCYWSREL